MICLLVEALPATAGGELDASGTLWTPYLEWSFDNPSFTGNAFDVLATVTFEHVDTGETHVSEMFYDGGTTWKVRFAGTKLGSWTAISSSTDPELDGLTGDIVISAGSATHGFLGDYSTADGTKWAWQGGVNGEKEATVPQIVMFYRDPKDYEDNPEVIDDAIQTFFVEHGFNGFHVPFVAGRWFDIEGDEKVESNNQDPDLRTLRALELLITRTHAAGGLVHIWAWGDQSRRWTPTQLDGGINGEEDQRLQRTIASRLGPLPGWSMGYGFDLDEWVSEEQVHSWRDYMQEKLGWFHYLGGRPAGPNSGTNHEPYATWNHGLDYSSYEHHEPDYEVYEAVLAAVSGQPAMSEDRFRIRGFGGSGKDYTMQQTRRGLWDSTMAGGVANIWGNLTRPDGSEIGTDLSLPYPNPEWIRTYATFFFGSSRFHKDLTRVNQRTDGVALALPDGTCHIFYTTNSDSIFVDLGASPGEQSAVAVDATLDYQEIDLGLLQPTPQTLGLPSVSDWAIAVGQCADTVFLDGLESGDTSGWSDTVGG